MIKFRDTVLPGPVHEIKDLEWFRNQRMSVPDFQRVYEWTSDTAVAFIADVVNRVADGYDRVPLGALHTYLGDDERYELVDGQQRMTTLFCAIAASGRLHGDLTEFRKLTHSDGFGSAGEHWIVFPHTPDAHVIYEILCAGGDGAFTLPNGMRQRDLSATAQNMLTNAEAIRQWLATEFDADTRPYLELWKRALRRIQFASAIHPGRLEAITAFEASNANVVPLKPAALVKNALFAAGEMHKTGDAIRTHWAAYEQIAPSSPKNSQQHLHAMLHGRYGTAENPLKSNRLFSWFSGQRNTLDVVDFTAQLATDAQAREQVGNGCTPTGEPSPYVDLLNKVSSNRKAHIPLVVAAGHLNHATFEQFAWRLAGLNLMFTTYKLRGQEMARVANPILEQLRSLDPDDIDSVDVIFDLAAEQVLHESSTDLVDLFAVRALPKALRPAALAMIATTYAPDHQRTDVLAVALRAGVDVEHIWPENSPTWNPTSVTRAPQVWDGDSERDLLGNLTLLDAGRNRAVGARSFGDKLAAYRHDPLMMTRAISGIDLDGLTAAERECAAAANAETGTGKWEVGRIEKRSRHLAARLVAACGANLDD